MAELLGNMNYFKEQKRLLDKRMEKRKLFNDVFDNKDLLELQNDIMFNKFIIIIEKQQKEINRLKIIINNMNN